MIQPDPEQVELPDLQKPADLRERQDPQKQTGRQAPADLPEHPDLSERPGAQELHQRLQVQRPSLQVMELQQPLRPEAALQAPVHLGLRQAQGLHRELLVEHQLRRPVQQAEHPRNQ